MASPGGERSFADARAIGDVASEADLDLPHDRAVPAWRWAIYVPLTRGGKIVVPRPYPETVSSNRRRDETALPEPQRG
jgi:hypothetical protein